ncbi:pathogenicity determinant protein PdpA1, partial [Francisella tularensis subsp. holarctica]|nr:pathogenicity determinant protein PdpA1 [Francisella tularensis subsp. holarctica]
SVDYIQSNNDDIQEIINTGFEILLTSRNTLPFLDNEITLSKLDNDQNYLLGAPDIKSLYISQRKLLFKRSKYCSKPLTENLHNFHYKSDSESDVY